MKTYKIYSLLLVVVLFSCQSLKNNSNFFKQKYTNLKVVNKKNVKFKININSNKQTHSNIKYKTFITDKKKSSLINNTHTKITNPKNVQNKKKEFSIKKINNIESKNNLINKKKIQNDSTSRIKNNNYILKKEYSLILLVVLSFLIPFLAVGLKTNWDMVKVILAFILWPTFFLSVIFALLIVYDIIDF